MDKNSTHLSAHQWAVREFNRLKDSSGITQADLGKALNITQPQAQRLLNGSRKIKANEIPELENFFGVPYIYQAPNPSAGVPLISWISAGQLALTASMDDFEHVTFAYAPDLDPGGDWIALRVDGRSMDKVSPHDSIIFVNRNERTLVPNACYIIGDGNGGATYKRFRAPNIFEAVSTKAEDYPSITFPEGQEPDIIGRVRKSTLDM